MGSRQNVSLRAGMIGALGVVYGDIGTSPLYTVKEVFSGNHYGITLLPINILGIMSLILWSLILVVGCKYVAFVMRADNRGEGGIIALMSLALHGEVSEKLKLTVTFLALAGAALFYGDSVVTPAVSVLSAVEGLNIAAPGLEHYVVPLTLIVLVALFYFQKQGSGVVGALFGPIMLLWFSVLAVMGVVNIIDEPQVLWAINPLHAVNFFVRQPAIAFVGLGAVVLAVTGGEALYADMGHFGLRPISLTWFYFVMPCLLLNYFGQAALLIHTPGAIENPFYLMAPQWALLPLVVLSTMAAVIASQSVISGAFSMTHQAIQMGYCPRFDVRHTSDEEMGQIYIPGVNRFMFVVVAGMVMWFGSSSKLAAAYGIAVTGTMVITTILAYVVAQRFWQWPRRWIVVLVGSFLLIDCAFFAANLLKVADGGWFILLFGLLLFAGMMIWYFGRVGLHRRISDAAIDIDKFLPALIVDPPTRVSGTGIYFSPTAHTVPHSLLHNLKHNKVLHERVVLLTVVAVDVPRVSASARVRIERFGHEFYSMKLFYGFMEVLDIPLALEWSGESGLYFDLMETSFFLGRYVPVVQSKSRLALWRDMLFVTMYRNADSMINFYRLPPNRVVELGAQVLL